jgi:hypothetical protein
VVGALLVAIAVALLAGTGLAIASSLGAHGWARLVLGAYVVALAEIVAVTLLLSPFGAVERPVLLAALVVLFVAALATARVTGAPRLPPLRRPRPPAVVLALGAVVVGALAYVVALVAGTPPNTWDSLTYHLARAALWRQDGGVGDVGSSYDARLDNWPPNAEIALTFVLELTRDERFAGFLQLAAALATATAVFALGRAVGLARAQAAFGALLFLTLPIVLLQSSTTQNDLVAASYLAAAAVFVLGTSRGELGLAALATALAVGTKIPAAYGVVVLLAVAVVATPRSARAGRVVAVVAGGALGSYWYVVNLVRSGKPLGDTPDPTDLVALLEPDRNLLGAYARVLDAFDLPGAEGADLYLYAVVAVGVAVGLLLARRRPRVALVTGALAAAPLLLIPVSYVLWRPFAKLHDVLGLEPDGLLPVAGWERQDSASEVYAWFGPLGLLLVLGVGVVAVALARRGVLPALAAVFALAPLAWLVLFSLSIGYDPWQGRFFIFPVALSAALWGLVLRVPAVAIATVAIATTTAVLSLVHFVEKPSGVRLLQGDPPPSVWRMERWEVQSILRAEMTPVLELVEEEIPTDATVALALREDDFGHPAFGRHLERRIELVPNDGSEVEADWLVASPEHAPEVQRSCWDVELETEDGWTIFRRSC